MKALSLTVLLGLLSLSALAGGWGSSTSDLEQYFNPKYTILKKGTLTEGIPNKGVKTSLGNVYTNLTNICQQNGMIQTINAVRMCAKWGYKVVRCDSGANEGKRECVDKDERVCKQYAKVHGSHPIVYTKKVCAKLSDVEGRAWRRQFPNRTFKKDYPNCSAFKDITMKLVTNYDFLIIKNFGYASSADERRYGGALVDEVDYTIPSCN